MPDPLAIRAFYACTCPAFTTPTDLNTLLAAAYALLGQTIPQVTASEIRITADVDNAVDVILGDSKLSATNYGQRYQAGMNDKYGTFRMSMIPLSNIFVMPVSGETSSVIHLVVIPA